MQSASRMVLRRCATTKLVRPRIRSSNAAWTWSSVRVSILLVASSNSKISGSASMTRAMHSSWRWPCESEPPPLSGRKPLSMTRRECTDERVCAGATGGLLHLLARGARAAVGDVVVYRPLEQPALLQHHAERVAKSLDAHTLVGTCRSPVSPASTRRSAAAG